MDKFEEARETLRRYAAAQTSIRPNAVRSKYIIVPGINDREEYIMEWLYMCKEFKIISVILNLDFNWIINNTELAYKQKDMPRGKDNTTLKLYDLIEFTKREGLKLGIRTSLYGEIFTIKTIVEGEISLNEIEE